MNFFKKILNYFKALIKPKKIESIETKQDDLFSSIEIGDIIWAKRYDNEQEKMNIPEGHREGSFIVIDKKNDKLLCAKGTSKEHEEKNDMYFEYIQTRNDVDRKINYRLCDLKVLNKFHVLDILSKLELSDKEDFFRELKTKSKYFNDENIKENGFSLLLQIGDIIVYNNNKYIVLDIFDNKMTIVCINNCKGNLKLENINKIEFYKKNIININADYKLINCVNGELLFIILKEYKKHLKRLEESRIPQRGSIVKKDDEYYYIYGEEGNEWLIFQLFQNSNIDLEEITVNNSTFYTNYKDLKIDKKENFDIVYLCYEKEIDDIKQKRIKYKEHEKIVKANKANQNPGLSVGDIIESKYYKNERFIIIKNSKKTYECLVISKLKQGIKDLVLLKKTDCKLSKNKSLEGIKWLEKNKTFNFKKIANEEIIDSIIECQIRFNTKKGIEYQVEDLKPVSKNKTLNYGDIIEIDESRYVVIKVIGNLISCVGFYDLYNKNYKIKYININDEYKILDISPDEKQKNKIRLKSTLKK